MAGTIMPFVKAQFFDANGDPLAGGQLFTYEAGTSSKLSTYSDSGLTTANANPTVLDAAGRATIFLSPASYKMVMAGPLDTDPPTSPLWTVDEVSAVPPTGPALDIQGTSGEALTAGQLVYLSDGTGGNTQGRWYLADADNYYSSAGAPAIAFVTADQVTAAVATAYRIGGRMTGLSALSVGSAYYISATPGSITSTAPSTNVRLVGYADSTTSLVLAEKPKAQTRERVAYSASTVGNVTTGEDVLQSYTAPAGELALDGMRYEVEAWGKTANNGDAKTIRVRLIETTNDTVLIAHVATISIAGHWSLKATILRGGATATRTQAVAFDETGNTSTVSPTATVSVQQPTCTWANAVTIRVTGEGTSTNDVTCEGFIVSREP